MSVAPSHSSGSCSSKSDSTMKASPSNQMIGGSTSILDFMKGMMDCGPMDGETGDAFEVTYDGKSDKVVHSGRHSRGKRRSSKSKKRSPKNRKEVAKTHEYIHVDDMTDDEIAESWYTTDDIKKFRKQKKDERRLRKQRIQKERMQGEGIDEYSDADSDYTSESDASESSFKKMVSWGSSMLSDSDSGASDQEEEKAESPVSVAKPVLKNSFSSEDTMLYANGMAFRCMKTSERTTMEQRRLAAMHKAFYRSGLLFRGEQNRMERFFRLSNQFEDYEVINKLEEEKKAGDGDNEYTAAGVLRDLAGSTPESNKRESTPVNIQGEEKTDTPFPPNAVMMSSPISTRVVLQPSSPIGNMDLVLSLQPTQRSKQHQYAQQNPFDSGDSFSFPSYPAVYDYPAQNEEYYEHRIDEVLEHRERSSELPDLTKKYQTFRKKLLCVVKSVKTYQKAISQMEQARSACFEECSTLIQEPPTGKIRPGTFQLAFEKSPITKLKEFAEMEQANRAKEFQEFVLDYVTRWEDDVTQRVDKELKQVKKLQQSRSHYEKKVDGLRKKVSGLEAKGKKETPKDLLVKLDRNEIKLRDAAQTHEWNASRLYALMEQVTQYGWKDLLPLVSNLMKYEFNRSGGELAMYGKFPVVLDSFQQPFRQVEEEGNINDLD